jgi:hypothetical protein
MGIDRKVKSGDWIGFGKSFCWRFFVFPLYRVSRVFLYIHGFSSSFPNYFQGQRDIRVDFDQRAIKL